MPITSTGSFRPGQASGAHSGYSAPASQYRGGFLDRVGSYQDRMAETELKLMQEELAQAELSRRTEFEEFQRSRQSQPVESKGGLTKDPTAAKMNEYMQWARTLGNAMSAGQRPDPQVTMADPTALGALPAMGMMEGRTGTAGPASFTPTSKPTSLTGLEKGTLPGTVPETRKYTIHKGETVLPRKQMDRPLMKYLVQDATRKGVPLGRTAPTERGYQKGSLSENMSPEEQQGWDETMRLIDALSTGTSFKKLLTERLPQAIGAGVGGVARGAGEAAGAYGRGVTKVGSEFFTGMMGEDYFRDTPKMDVAAEKAAAFPDEAQQAAMGSGYTPTGRGAPTDKPSVTGTGSAEDPFTMTGQLTEREEAYKQMRGDVGYREAKHGEGMAQAQVKNLLTALQYHGNKMDPEVKKGLLEQLGFQSKIRDQYSKELAGKEKILSEELGAATDFAQKILTESAKQELMGERQEKVAKTKAQLDTDELAIRESGKALRLIGKGLQSTNARTRKESMTQLVNQLRAVAIIQGTDISSKELLDIAEFLGGLDPQTFEVMVPMVLSDPDIMGD